MNSPPGHSGHLVAVQAGFEGIGVDPLGGEGVKGNGIPNAYVQEDASGDELLPEFKS